MQTLINRFHMLSEPTLFIGSTLDIVSRRLFDRQIRAELLLCQTDFRYREFTTHGRLMARIRRTVKKKNASFRVSSYAVVVCFLGAPGPRAIFPQQL